MADSADYQLTDNRPVPYWCISDKRVKVDQMRLSEKFCTAQHRKLKYTMTTKIKHNSAESISAYVAEILNTVYNCFVLKVYLTVK